MMKKPWLLLLTAGVCALLWGETQAQVLTTSAVCTQRPLRAYAKETITVSSTALGFTVATMTASNRSPIMVMFTTETDAIRWWDDGSTPTATVGHLVPVNSERIVCGSSIGRFRMIRVTGDVSVTATYYD